MKRTETRIEGLERRRNGHRKPPTPAQVDRIGTITTDDGQVMNAYRITFPDIRLSVSGVLVPDDD